MARDDLIQRINQVDGGSFALAGPRGAGKTILMRAFCGGRFSANPGRDLGIVVSAPVDYE
jgi:GTPase SAR1 family protein